MRIISGKLGGRNIYPPNNMPFTRPTTDIAKEGLFNVLQNNLDFTTLHTLDLFGGTGCISYELISRGVIHATIIEKDKKMFEFINKTISQLNIVNTTVYQTSVNQYLKNCSEKFNFIFAGPPYALVEIEELPALIFTHKLLHKKGWFVLEHTPRNDFKKNTFYKTERKYGTTLFSIFIETRNHDES